MFKGLYSKTLLTIPLLSSQNIDMYSQLSNYYYAKKHFPDDSYTLITFIVNILYSNGNPAYNSDTF